MIDISFFSTGIIDRNSKGPHEVVLFFFEPVIELTGVYRTMFLEMLTTYSWSIMDGNQFYSETGETDEEGYTSLVTKHRVSTEAPYSVAISIPLDSDGEIDEIFFHVTLEMAEEHVEALRTNMATVYNGSRP